MILTNYEKPQGKADMEILTQTIIEEYLKYFLQNWRIETMIAIIVFLITFYFMDKKINYYKFLNECYEELLKETCYRTENISQKVEDIKTIALKIKEKDDREKLLKEIREIVQKEIESNRET